MTTTQATCAERVESHKESRLADLKVLYRPHDCDADELVAFCEDEGIDVPEDDDESLILDATEDEIYERQGSYGLCFGYTEDEETGLRYFRYCLSTGGPHEEIRFFVDYSGSLYKAEFWLLDWYDGACRTITGDDTAQATWDFFVEIGAVEAAFAEWEA